MKRTILFVLVLAMGNIVADELYHQIIPIIVLSKEDFVSIKQDDYLAIKPDGKVLVGAKLCTK